MLNHSILELTYKRIAERGLAISEENRAEALQIFDEAAAQTLLRAPADLKFRATATWPQEQQILVARLKALIEKDFSADSPLSQFGTARRVYQLERYFSEAAIDLPAGLAPLRVNGFIDRIDLVDGQLVVVDYKSGGTKINRDEMAGGRDFQMLIYTEALSNALTAAGGQAQVAGGLVLACAQPGGGRRFRYRQRRRQRGRRSCQSAYRAEFAARAGGAIPGACQQTRKWQMLALLRVFSSLPPAGHRPPQAAAAG